MKALRIALPVLTFVLLGVGAWLGLVWAPPEREMGDVYRIIYVHVPLVKLALLGLSINFGASVWYLFQRKPFADALAEASAEVGLAYGSVGVLLGSIWGRPTWGTYWTWDPRLTTAAIMIVLYMGYMALRRFVDNPDSRATWSAVVAIISAVDIPIVYYAVRVWRSIHQMQSSPSTVDADMVFALRWNLTAFFILMLILMYYRTRIALRTKVAEQQLPPLIAPGAAA